MVISNLKMPIKTIPYRHQEEAFKFVCECFGLTKSGDELIEQNGQSEVHALRENISKKKNWKSINITFVVLIISGFGIPEEYQNTTKK